MRKTVLLLLLGSAVMFGQLVTMPFRPVDLEYSYSLDRIIAVSSGPSQLQIYDPAFNTSTSVSLPKPPTSVSVSPDGKFAAVGHDALVSYVNLSTAAVEKTFAVAGNVRDLVLGPNYIYTTVATVNITTGAVTGGLGEQYVTNPRLHPGLKAIYSTRDGLSPNDVEKTDISAGTIGSRRDSPYHGDYPACGGIWYSPDGNRIYTGCAAIYNATQESATDMTYKSTLENLSRIIWLDHSAIQKKIVAVPEAWTWSEPHQGDSEFRLFDSTTLNPIGTYKIPSFPILTKTYAVHGKRAFFRSDGQKVFIVGQVDSSSGLLNDYVLYTWSSTNSGTCSPVFTTASATAIAAGQIGTVSVTAPADCSYEVFSDHPWVQLISGQRGSGDGTVTWIARPNSLQSSRRAEMRVGSVYFAVDQDSPPPSQPQLMRLSFNVADAEFSKALNKIVAISAKPAELHLIDPVTKSDEWLALTWKPLSVSVRPDGLYAAVGHDGWISIVNLQTRTVERTYEISSDVNDIVLASNGYVYALPARAWSDIYAVHLGTGKITPISAIYDGRIARLHPSEKMLYTGDSSWFARWDISAGTLTRANRNSSSSCGNFWIAEDGSRMFTQCGKVYRLSEVDSADVQYNGQLSDATTLYWAAHSSARYTTAAAVRYIKDAWSGPTANEIQFYGDAYLGLAGKYAMPKLAVSNTSVTMEPAFLFWDKTSSGLAVLARSETAAKLTNEWAVTWLSPDSQPSTCTFALSGGQPVAATGGFGSVGLTTGTGCFWTASSSASWLKISSGGFGTGTANIGFSADPNPTNVARSATISVGTSTITVTQAAGTGTACTYQIVGQPFLPFAEGGKATFSVVASAPGCAWTASSDASWLQVFPLTGTGSATITLTAFPSFRSTHRVGTITVEKQSLMIIQSASGLTPTQRFVSLLYFGFFGRLPLPAELAFHTQSLTAGTTRADAATNFMGSTELALGGKYVGGVYIGVLNRDAEYGGWLFQRNAMLGAQISGQALVGNFINSAEYALRFGAPTNAEFVRLLYRHILGREATAPEVDFQAGGLSGGIARNVMAYGFLSSTEFRVRTNARLDAFLLYTGLLSRHPTEAELAATMATIHNSGLKAAITNVLATPEFDTAIQ